MRETKIAVLFVIPSLRRAGAQTQLIDLINGIDKTRFKVHLFTFEKELDQLGRLNSDDVSIYSEVRGGKFDVINVAKSAAGIIDKEHIDIVHCTLHFALLIGWLALRYSTRKAVLCATVHSTLSESLKDEIKVRFVYRRLLGRCKKVIFVCENQRQYWVGRFKELSPIACTIHNGVDTAYFNVEQCLDEARLLKTQLTIPDNELVLGCIARFRPEKGHRILLQAVARLEPEPWLLLAGDGEKQDEIQQLGEALQLTKVRFLGSVDDVRPVLCGVDMSILASTAVETFSIAMLESMALSTPMLATDIGGMNEAIRPGVTGELVEPNSEESLYRVLADCLKDPARLTEMGVQARELVEKEFSVERMVSLTETVFEDLLEPPDNFRQHNSRCTS